MEQLVIIGNGISGITVARHVRKRSNMKILVISKETDHFFSRTALMYIYMGHMNYEHTKPYEDWFWEKNRIELLRGTVTDIRIKSNTLLMADGNEIKYDKLVLATGSSPNKFGWPGQDLPGVQGLFSYPDLELMEENTKTARNAVIVGGGLIGIEMAEMLLSRGISVTFLVREAHFWGNVLPAPEGDLISRHGEDHGVTFRFNTELKAIKAGPNGRASTVLTNHGDEIDAQFVGLTAGVHPNVSFLQGTDIEIGRGVLVNDFLETNIADVYACGDCAEIVTPEGERNRIEPLWYTGRMQAEALAKTITGERTFYERGVWFNSAKFFDIEYQTYGFVPAQRPDGYDWFYWESDSGMECFRAIYRHTDRVITGMHTFGIRMRQNVWQKWIADGRTVDQCVSQLRDAEFDPEFYTDHTRAIQNAFTESGGTINAGRKKWTFKRILQEF